MRDALRSILWNEKVEKVLHVDSRDLFATISILDDGREYRLGQTVQRIRNSFEAGDISTLRWIPTGQNLADYLKHRCPKIHIRRNIVYRNGIVNPDSRSRLSSHTMLRLM